MTDSILFVGDLIMVTAVVGAVVFALSYAFFFNWRKTDAGRALMYFVWSLIAVFTSNTLARFLGVEYFGREWVRLAVYICVAVTTWRLVFVLWRNWQQNTPVLNIQSRNRSRN